MKLLKGSETKTWNENFKLPTVEAGQSLRCCFCFFFKEIGFIADGWLQRVHNLNSVKTVPVTSYIEVLQNVVFYLY